MNRPTLKEIRDALDKIPIEMLLMDIILAEIAEP